MANKDIIGISSRVTGVQISMMPEGVISVYFRMSDKPVSRSSEGKTSDVIIDLDKDGKIVGLELINPTSQPINTVLNRVAKHYGGAVVKRFQEQNHERIEKLQDLVSV